MNVVLAKTETGRALSDLFAVALEGAVGQPARRAGFG